MDRTSKLITVAITAGLIGPISIHYVYLIKSTFLRSLVLYCILTGNAPRWIPPNHSPWFPLLIIVTGLLLIPREGSLIPVVFNCSAAFLLPPLVRHINLETALEDATGELAFSLVAMGPLASYLAFLVAFRMIVAVWSFTISAAPITLWEYLIVVTIVSTLIVRGVRNDRCRAFIQEYASKLGGSLPRHMSKVTQAIIGAIIEVVTFLNQMEGAWIDSNIATNASTEPEMYQYSPMGDCPRNIRLLKLLRRKPFTRIRCELTQVSLDQTPSFEAISYTWGGQKPEIDIIMDGKHSLVTPSVFEILRHRQSFFSDTYLWIDAVCINQRSPDDKNRQIALMRDIYQQSTRVVIWLGPRQSVKNSFDTYLMLICLASLLPSINQQFPSLLRASDPGWVFVGEMFSHPWFTRSWIMQEVVASKVAHIMYGNVLFKWTTLEIAVDVLMSELVEIPGRGNRRPIVPTSIGDLIQPIKNANAIAGLRKFGRLTSLQDALGCSTTFNATDPRDRVFALLGITDESVGNRFAADYHYGTIEAYIHTMRYLLSGRKSISTVTHPFDLAGIGFPRSTKVESFDSNTSKEWDNLDEDLPSWVVDWSSKNTGRNVLNKDEISPQGQECDFTDIFTENIGVIRMEGYEIDQIIALNNTTFAIYSSGTWEERLLQLHNLRTSYYSAKSLAHSGSATAYPNIIELNNGFWESLTGTWTTPGLQHFRNAVKMQIFEATLDVVANPLTRPENLDDYYRLMARFGPDSNSNMFHFGNACGNRIFAITKGGRLAVVPPRSMKGDMVCYLKHLRCPYLLRPKPVNATASSTSQRYQLVGGCYVHGLMAGPRDFSQGLRYELE